MILRSLTLVALASGCLETATFQGEAEVPRGRVTLTTTRAAGTMISKAVVVDPAGATINVVQTNPATGQAVMDDVPAGSTVWVLRELDNGVDTIRQLTALVGVTPGDSLVVGEPILGESLQQRRIVLPVLDDGTEYGVITRCSPTPATAFDTVPHQVLLDITARCRGQQFPLVGSARDATGTLFTLRVENVTDDSSELRIMEPWTPAGSFAQEVTVPPRVGRLFGYVEARVDGVEVASAATFQPPSVVPGESVVGAGELPVSDTLDLLYEVDLVDPARRQQWVAHRRPWSSSAADDIELAPWVGEATGTASALAWAEDEGTYQLRIIDGQVVRPTDFVQLRYRYVLPPGEPGGVSLPPVPSELSEVALPATPAISYQVHLLRFDDGVTYDDARQEAGLRFTGEYRTDFLGAPRKDPTQPPITRVAHSGPTL